MKKILRFSGRYISATEINFIKKFIRDNPDISRWKLSRAICELWDLKHHNGSLKDQLFRTFLLKLERENYLTLPLKKSFPPNPSINRKKQPNVEIDKTPIETSLKDILPIEIKMVKRTPLEKLFNSLIEHYHYLGHKGGPGANLKYIAFYKKRPVAAILWKSSPLRIRLRDSYIAWSNKVRDKNLHLICYQTRFTILPWVKVPHLASHLLAKNCKCLCSDWQKTYKHPIFLVETFVDTEKFKGTCYKAAGWTLLGNTKGRGRRDLTNKKNRPIKSLWVKPLTKKFKQKLCT